MADEAPRPPDGAGPPDEATRVLGADAGAGGGDATVIATAPAGGRGAQDEAGLLPVGARVAEFEITRVIGQGGFGVVYEAWDTDLERVVAVKEYLPASLATRAADGTVAPLSERTRETFELGMRSFINEARLLAQFDHPSLLKVWRFWQEKDTTYMAMPFYRGPTLRQALAERPGGVDEGWLMPIVDGVTQALAVMHAANCYHRDIAPDNIILLADSGRPVLLDFGAARRVISDKTQAITVILKPGYAPIEQYAEMPDMAQGPWTDVYALAAVMHVAVAGRAPPPSVARMINDSYRPLAQDAQLRARYGERLLAAIDAGLGVRPEQRPASMAQLRGLLGLEAGADVPARAARAAPADDDRTVIVKPGDRRTVGAAASDGAPPSRLPLLAGGGLLALLLAGGGWWWARQPPAPEPPAPATAQPQQAPADAPAREPAAPPVASAPPAAPASPAASAPATPQALKPVTALESLQSLARGATPGFTVNAAPAKAEVSIGKDALAFEVRSNRAGYVYVFLLSSGNELFLLFPNLLDKRNRINANSALTLPRPAWPMNSGGPPGPNEFAVLVSENERDFAASGMQSEGVFPQFPLPQLGALEAARGTGPAPLLGQPQCAPGTPCRDAYGVGFFRIVER